MTLTRPFGALACAAILAVAVADTASSAVTCSRYASPSGSDGAAGTAAAPFRTATRLAQSLQAGQAGCLAPGATFVEDLRVDRGGTPGLPITLTTTPGGSPATVRGRMYVTDRANDVVVSRLRIDGRNATNLPSPTVNGDRVTFADNDVTNYNTGICFIIGSNSGYGIANGVVITRNRIHNCGRLPRTNLHHGIYMEASHDGQVTDNAIFDNADRGVQLYPNAQRNLIARNVIDGNGVGVIFSGDNGHASSHNIVVNNVITYSAARANIESWWPSGNPVGTGNLAQRNCVWGGRTGNIGSQIGFTATGTIVAEPQYANRAAKDFTLTPTSRCAGLGIGSTATRALATPLKRKASRARRSARRTARARTHGRLGAWQATCSGSCSQGVKASG